MKRLFFILLFVSSCLVHAFEDAPLAVGAAQYRQLIGDSRLTSTGLDKSSIPAELRRAERYARQQLWREAISAYENIIASGENSSAVWLLLAKAWQHWESGHRAEERALQAGYNAYKAAQTDSGRAQALFLLGDLYRDLQQQPQPKQAIAAWQEALGLQENPEYAERYRNLVAATVFRITGLEVDSDSSTPKICLQFSASLQQGRELHYEDYLVIQPALNPVVSARGDRLCIEGVEHGQSYDITVRPGIPAAGSGVTAASEHFSTHVDNRKPSLGFRGATYILPRNGGQGLPLTTVNIDHVKLKVLRINDRNLLQQINDQRITGSLDGYDIESIAERSGELFWEGDMPIESQLNEEATTAIPMDEVLKHTAPGIYIVTAESDDDAAKKWQSRATQWLVISDLGISTFRGEDGLHVFVRSLDSAQPLADVDLRLYSRNNSELGQARTDTEGHARFDPGLLRGARGQSAAALMAYHSKTESDPKSVDFNFLDLTRPHFDLSDHGVEGRKAPGPIDVFLYTERGVYRPGESVELMALMRDNRGYALDGSPLILKLFRPDEVEIEQLTLTDSNLGGFHVALALADNARTGSWTVRAYTDPKAEPVGQLSFQVEDFVPQRIRLELSASSELLSPGEVVTVQANGRFLYGAPAANLNAQAELVLREDPEPYPRYAGYNFGLVQEDFTAKRFPLDITSTDAAGTAQVAVYLDEIPDTSRLLKAILRVSVFEPGGRPVNKILGLPYRTQPFAIGIKPRFDDSVPIGQQATFDVIALDHSGEPIAVEGLRYELFREEYDYYWFYRNNRWDYKLIIRDSDPVTNRTLTLPKDRPLELVQPGLDWGNYRAEIYDLATGIASSVRFRVGWFVNPSADDTPDRLQLTLDKPVYQAGETAQIHIKAPFIGEVLLTVASDRLWTTRQFRLDASGATIDLPVSADWGPGVYLTATAFRPAQNPAQRGPGRAIGVSWLKLDPAPRTLAVSLQTPTEVTPRQTFELPITVMGTDSTEPTYISVAAVDEGILQLTDFSTPNPLDYYLGKRRLGVEIRDVYGRLIESAGHPGRLRTGGDGFGRQLDGAGVRTVKTVALFSGPVALDGAGKAHIPLELPDFNGELRLMVVAWNHSRLGRAESALLVRDPLVTRVYLPRFLAPGDRARLSLQIQNLSAMAGDYKIHLEASGAVTLEPQTFTFGVADSVEQNMAQRFYTMQGLLPGVGHIRLQVTGPGGFGLEREWEIAVRPAQAITRERITQRLPPSETLLVDATLLDAYLPETGELHMSFASRPNLDVPALLTRLSRYPYGCLEQVTSRALPLLYFNKVAQAWLGNKATDAGLRARVQEAIQNVFTMQRYEGGFGLWNQESPAEQWLSAYALDFLTRAKAESYLVPAVPYQRGLDWLKHLLADDDYNAESLAARAYALYVLARADQAAIGDLRYLHDNYLARLPTNLARAQLGAALARYGDIPRAGDAFSAALHNVSNRQELRDYGTDLRDRAALLTLLLESNQNTDALPSLADRLADEIGERHYTSTQEQAWLLLAAHALSKQQGALRVSIDGSAPGTVDPLYLNPSMTELERGLRIVNQGDQALWYALNISGVPTQAQPSEQSGFSITRRYYTRAGEPVDTTQIKQNDLLVALISGQASGDENHQALIVDLLPAGLEIENARLASNASTDDLGWLPELSDTLNVELRDDRYVAALDLNGPQENFAVAYLVRAVTPGKYRLPAIFVEDMYKPWYFGRGIMAELMIE